jgi:tape measure domain-containing protein
MATAGGALDGLKSRVAGVGATMLKITGIGAGVTAVLGSIGGLGGGIKLAAELEQTGIAFETMLGSAGAAKAMMGELAGFAASTPFEFPGIAASAKQLLAFGVANTDAQSKLQMLGDISAGTGKDLQELAGIYGKIKSRGQLTGETLNQLAEAGVPIYRNLAASLGVAENAIAGMVSAGTVGFPQVDAALAAMTATGGQFSGLMAKQSQSLGGLWSTFTDTVSMGLASITQTIFDAFDVKGILGGVIGQVGSFGAWVTTQVAAWATPVINVAKSIYSAVQPYMGYIAAGLAGIGLMIAGPAVVGAIGLIGGAIASLAAVIVSPIGLIVGGFAAIGAAVGMEGIKSAVAATGAFISQNWQSWLDTAMRVGTSIYGFVSGAFNGIWSVVQKVGAGISAAWTGAMNMLGIQTGETGLSVGGVFQKISDGAKWLGDTATLAINILTFGLNNLGTVAAFVGVGIAYQVVRIGNEFHYVFGTVIPGLLSWFGNNWRDIFTTAANWLGTVFTNMAANAASFGKALYSMLTGDGFNFEWVGLTEGFKNTIKELPAIAAREIGPLEKALGDRSAALGQALTQGLGDYLNQQDKAAKDAAASISGTFKGLAGLLKRDVLPTIVPPPEIVATAKIATDTEPAEAGLEKLNEKGKEVAGTLATVLSGSAESMQLAAQGAFDALKAAAPSSATAAAQPASPSAAAANAASQAAKGNDTAIVATLRAILAQLQQNPGGVELYEADAA